MIFCEFFFLFSVQISEILDYFVVTELEIGSVVIFPVWLWIIGVWRFD